MCGYQVETVVEQRSISFSIPDRTVKDVRTIVIGCGEENSLPDVQHLERLQPLAFIKTAGGRLFGRKFDDAGDGLRFLESILSTAPDVEHIVVCLHTGCSSMCPEPDTGCGSAPMLQLVKSESVAEPTRHGSEHHEGVLFPYERMLLEQLLAVATILKRNSKFTSKQIRLHGLLFEPEIEWISFFDFDTGQLLPLNAHMELCI